MELHHLIILIFKILFLIILFLVKLKIIPTDTPLQYIIDYTFKLLLGIFVLYVSFPWRKNFYSIQREDLVFLFMCGILLLITIDYKNYLYSFKIFFERLKQDNKKKLKPI